MHYSKRAIVLIRLFVKGYFFGCYRRIDNAPPTTSPTSDVKPLNWTETPADLDEPPPEAPPVDPAGEAVVVTAPAETAAEKAGGLVALLLVST